MTNRILSVAYCTALAMSVPVLAAPGHAPPDGMAVGEGLNKALDLTEAQQEALRQARREAITAHREARADGADPRELRREHAQAMREVYEGVLTEEQLEKLEDMRDGRRAKQRDRFVERLDLQADQVEPVLAILADARRNARSGDAAHRQERRAAVREQLSEVLTPEQMERLDAMHSERRGQKGAWRAQDRSDS